MRDDRRPVASADELTVSRFSGPGLPVGRFAGRPDADRWVWDGEMFCLLGYDATAAPASLAALLDHVPTDERCLVADAFEAAGERQRSFTVSCRLHTADFQFRSVLIVVEVNATEPSGPDLTPLLHVDGLEAATGPWLTGQIIDLTELRLSATRAAADHAVVEATKHRAVIEQAKGMLMLAYHIDADAGFALLRRVSSVTNTKLHDVAAGLVADAAMATDFAELRAHLGRALERPGPADPAAER